MILIEPTVANTGPKQVINCVLYRTEAYLTATDIICTRTAIVDTSVAQHPVNVWYVYVSDYYTDV